jgi:VanZ family protein
MYLAERFANLRYLRVAWFVGVVVVTIISLLPEDSRPIQTLSLVPFGDKVHHALSYAVLGFIPVLREKRRTAAVLVAAGITLGWVIEVLQGYTGRTPDVADGIADLMGITVGVLIGLAFRSR